MHPVRSSTHIDHGYSPSLVPNSILVPFPEGGGSGGYIGIQVPLKTEVESQGGGAPGDYSQSSRSGKVLKHDTVVLQTLPPTSSLCPDPSPFLLFIQSFCPWDFGLTDVFDLIFQLLLLNSFSFPSLKGPGDGRCLSSGQPTCPRRSQRKSLLNSETETRRRLSDNEFLTYCTWGLKYTQ